MTIQCCNCNKVRSGEQWETARDAMDGDVSHTYSPSCFAVSMDKFRAEKAARSHLDGLGGSVVEFPELHTASMLAIDHSGLSFWAAIHTAEGERALRPLDRQRVRLWLERCYAALEAVVPLVESSAIQAHSNWIPAGDHPFVLAGQDVTN